MQNTKFFNRRLKPEKKTGYSAVTLSLATDVLQEACNAWTSLENVRRKTRRSVMYAYEDQWGDVIRNPDFDRGACDQDTGGRYITEAKYIMNQGKVPLKNNVIRPIVKNIDGQFRQNQTRPVCVVRDPKEAKVGEMMSIALEYAYQMNEIHELDAASLNTLMMSGMCMQRVEYGFNPARQALDAWAYNSNPFRMFFNANVEDVRAWDVNIIGEMFDITYKDVAASFAQSREDAQSIRSVYGERMEGMYQEYNGMGGEQNKNMDFYVPARDDLCRVILVWKKESREAYFCHDTLNGEWWYGPLSDKPRIEEINRQRTEEALANGVETEDILLIEYQWEIEQYWYYRYLSPNGYVLKEGRSPYWHKQHNYILNLYPLVHGKVFNFVEDFIDQQRAINRTVTTIDFVRGASAKGLLIVDEDAIEGMSREQIVDEYIRYNGVIFATLKPGKNIDNVIKQYHGQAVQAGDYELLNLQIQLINDISGVNSAMQGKAPASGTPASLYAQQVQNSSLNIKGLLESFRNFRIKRDNKLMQTIQQFYTSRRYIDLAGNDYSEEAKFYNPERVQQAEIDVSVTEGTNTPVYQMVMNDFLMTLFDKQAITVKQLLENSSLPFATRILESIKRDEQAIEEARMNGTMPQLEGIPQDVSGQVAAGSNADLINGFQRSPGEIKKQF
ncbi:MAG: hypothetical protein LBU37_10360 [Tannerellaceae bacterium]|jgi:hypothetical protein|nr:hypothetical protein [Tannerellaceae bacterium]